MAQAAEKIELFDVDSDEALARKEAALAEAERIVEALLLPRLNHSTRPNFSVVSMKVLILKLYWKNYGIIMRAAGSISRAGKNGFPYA